MRRTITFFALIIFVTSCSAPSEKSNPNNSNLDSIVQPTPTCSNEELQGGSAWIAGQLAAFGESEPDKAYSYASAEFKNANDLESFAAVIMSQYTMLLDIKDYKILSCEKNGELFLFKLRLSDNQSIEYKMEYILSLRNNKWGVDGASVALNAS